VKCVIKLTPWLLDEDHIENALRIDRFAGSYEHPDRTRDDIDAKQRLIDADIKHASPSSYDPGLALLHPMLPERVACRC